MCILIFHNDPCLYTFILIIIRTPEMQFIALYRMPPVVTSGSHVEEDMNRIPDTLKKGDKGPNSVA
jgi:hypothetical protein